MSKVKKPVKINNCKLCERDRMQCPTCQSPIYDRGFNVAIDMCDNYMDWQHIYAMEEAEKREKEERENHKHLQQIMHGRDKG